MSQPMQILTSQRTVNWYTPLPYIVLVKHVLGEISLDPASAEIPQGWIKARTYWTAGGLDRQWSGRVFLNPPYPAAPWVAKLMHEYDMGHLDDNLGNIALVNANLGYAWFERFWRRFPTCLVRERIYFVSEDGKTTGQSKKASAFVYLGPRTSMFEMWFKEIGRIVLP